jgi:tricorn protease
MLSRARVTTSRLRISLLWLSALTIAVAGAAGTRVSGRSIASDLAAPATDAAPAPDAAQAPRVALAEPGISPDGKEIAFVSGGDIWTVPATGGEARLLVSHPAAESRPLYSPDGRSLAFVSTRTGNGDIYVLTLDTGDLRRVTFDDAAEVLNGWSNDSKAIYFSSNSHDIAGMNDIFRIDVAGGTAMPVTSEVYFNEFFGAVSPDGIQLAFSARGFAGTQWWRHGHSHLDESEIWIRGLNGADAGAGAGAAAARYRQITARGAKAVWPMWAADGQAIFFMADRNGAENIWRVAVGSASMTPPSGTNMTASKSKSKSKPGTTDGQATRPGSMPSSFALAPAAGAGGSNGALAGAAAAPFTQDAAKAVTDFKDGRVLWPSITKDGRTIAFERNFGIWTLDTASGKAQPLAITRRGAPAGAAIEHVRLTSQLSGLALSPDGKKIAFAAHGDLFAASAKDGGDAMRVSATTNAIESDAVWTSDSRRIVFVSDQNGHSGLHIFDVAASSDTTLTTGHRDYAPAIAPDGKTVAFLRDQGQVCTLPLTAATSASATAPASASTPAAKTAEKCIAQAPVAGPLEATRTLTWSPDSRWLAFIADGAKGFSNVQVVPADGSAAAKAVSFVPNTSSGSLVWSPDGTFLMFGTGQRTETSQAARVDLVLRTPKFREDQFRDLFPSEPTPNTPSRTTPATPPASTPAPAPTTEQNKKSEPDDTSKDAAPKNDSKDSSTSANAGANASAAKKPPKKTEIVFDDIRQRLTYLPIGLDVNDIAISHDGKTLLLTVANAGQENLYLYSIDELAKERPVPRQVTSTSGNKRSAQFSADDKEVFFLDEGRVQVASVEKREARPLAVAAEMDIDFNAERLTIFDQAWSMMNENFYDAAFHGANWQEMRTRFTPYAAGAANNAELRRLISLMIGELNASHLGINPPPDPSATATGRLGVRFDADEYARSGKLKVASVIPLGPAAVSRQISTSDVLAAVNGTPLTRGTNLDQLLDHTIGKRVVLAIENAQGTKKDVAVQPVNLATDKRLRYREWVEARRAYVAKISNGRLGYVHMIDMSADSLSQLYADLDVENHTKDGVVIDIRNNNGGFVNAYAIDVFARRPYLNMTFRGRPTAPARTILGQRALESPTVLVVNQHSLSDAEDFTEGYRTLKLGAVVGEPTAGWIIYTGNERLIDGSIFRLPRIRITDHEGKDMERHPRPVDVAVTRDPGEDAAGVDTQLQKAVAELLKVLPAGAQRAER